MFIILYKGIQFIVSPKGFRWLGEIDHYQLEELPELVKRIQKGLIK